MSGDAAGTSPAPGTNGTTPPPAPNRGAILRRTALLVGILAFVFAVVLPRVVDYNAVGAALAALTTGQLVLLVAATAVAYIANAGPCRVLVPQLTWPHAVAADLAARAVVSVIPGPTDIATRFRLYRTWSIPADTASAGIAIAALFESLSSLVLPLIATFGVIVSGHEMRPQAAWLALVGLIVFAVASVLLAAIVRSEGLARRFGQALDRWARRIWTFFRKPPPSDLVAAVLDLRERSMEILSRHGLLAFGLAVVAKLAWFAVLEVSLLVVGIDPAILPPSAVLAAIAVVGIVALIPITPGAVGVSEVAYISVLTSVGGVGLTEQITAAVLLLRIAQWLVPIPIGWVLLVLIRGRQPDDSLTIG